MAFGKEIFRKKYKESYDCCQKIINNYYDLDQEYQMIAKELQQKENIIKEVREDLYQVVKWCTESKHNEDTIERYLVVDYGTIVGKINEIRTKLDKENKE